jgi:hypothetical protein
LCAIVINVCAEQKIKSEVKQTSCHKPLDGDPRVKYVALTRLAVARLVAQHPVSFRDFRTFRLKKLIDYR